MSSISFQQVAIACIGGSSAAQLRLLDEIHIGLRTTNSIDPGESSGIPWNWGVGTERDSRLAFNACSAGANIDVTRTLTPAPSHARELHCNLDRHCHDARLSRLYSETAILLLHLTAWVSALQTARYQKRDICCNVRPRLSY